MIVLADERESLAADRLVAQRGALGAAGDDADVLHASSLPPGRAAATRASYDRGMTMKLALPPVYDRNPQQFVPSIFWARPENFQKAVQRIYHLPGQASFVELPLVTKN